MNNQTSITYASKVADDLELDRLETDKADTTYVDTQDNLKADITYVDSQDNALGGRIDDVENNIDETEADILALETANMFKDVTYTGATGVLQFTLFDNTTKTVDLPLELLVESGYYDEATNELVLVLANASEIRIPVSDLLSDLDAVNVRYNNVTSGLDAENVQEAIDEIAVKANYILDSINQKLSYEVVEGLTLKKIFEDNQLIVNPDFNDNTSWVAATAGVPTFEDGVVKFTATAQYGSIKQNITSIVGHLYYVVAKIKGNSTGVRLQHSSFATTLTSHSGSGEFEILSRVDTATSDSADEYRVMDIRSSGWAEIQADYFYVIDLTNLGITKTKAEMDAWFDLYLKAKNDEEDDIFQPYLYQNQEIIDIDTNNHLSLVSLYKEEGENITKLKTFDQYKFPLVPVWGHEYMYSWYEKLFNNANIKMVWAGDSTTSEYPTVWDGYRRYELGAKILRLGGYESAKITNVNNGRGSSVSGSWIGVEGDIWYAAGGQLADQMALNPDILFVGFGINDRNYNSTTLSISERLTVFENNMREGLTRIRGSVAQPTGAAYNKSADVLAVVLVMPITNDDARDWWLVHVRTILQKLAREFCCGFVDATARHYDHSFSLNWSWHQAEPYEPDGIHPSPITNADWCSMMADLVFPLCLHKETV